MVDDSGSRSTWRGQVAGHVAGVHIDLYAPFQSRLGANLQLRVEALVPYAETVGGRRLLSVPAHVATKVAACWTGRTACPAVRTAKSCTPSWPSRRRGCGRRHQSRFAAHPGPGCCADRAGVRVHGRGTGP